jgi:hypothetical protein
MSPYKRNILISNYQKSSVLLMSLMFLLLAWGCKKPPDEMLLSEEIRSFAIFPEGSYWIYRDSLTGAKDSSAYRKVFFETNNDHNFGECIIERATIQMSRSFYGFVLNGTVSSYCDVDIEWMGFGIQTLYIQGSLTPTADPDVFTEMEPGIESDGCFYEAFHETMIVNAVPFYNVQQYRITRSSGAGYFARVYFSPGIGIVKQETEDGRIWELERYYVE